MICTKCGEQKPIESFEKGRRQCCECMNLYYRDWKRNHPESRRESQRRYAISHPEIIRKQRKRDNNKYIERHRAEGLCLKCSNPVVQGKTYCQKHIEADTARNRRSNHEIKKLCIDKYGGKCACCGEDKIAFLTIDHIEGGGSIHRRSLFGYNVGGVVMYRWLRKQNYPLSGYQALCMNCNFATRFGDICPHKEESA